MLRMVGSNGLGIRWVDKGIVLCSKGNNRLSDLGMGCVVLLVFANMPQISGFDPKVMSQRSEVGGHVISISEQ